MAAVNKVILVGNLGRDPEMRKTPGGASVVSFSMATTEKFTDKNGQRQEQTEWHNIVAWNRTAETIEKYVKKGDPIYIEGKLRTQSWEDNGNRRYKTEVVVVGFQFLHSGNGNNSGQQGQFGQQQQYQNNQQYNQNQNFGNPPNYPNPPQYSEPPMGYDNGFANQEAQDFYNGR